MSEKVIHSERDLLKRVAGGDEAAFSTLFHNYRDKIYSIAYELTHSAATAEEVVQDVFVIIWTRRTVLMDVQHFTAYLFTIARHEVYAAMKRAARFERQDAQAAYPVYGEVEDLVSLKEYERILQAAVGRLPSQQRQVYRLIREDGLKRDEAAAVMKVSPETVKSYLAQAMRNIRAYCMAVIRVYILMWWFFA